MADRYAFLLKSRLYNDVETEYVLYLSDNPSFLENTEELGRGKDVSSLVEKLAGVEHSSNLIAIGGITTIPAPRIFNRGIVKRTPVTFDELDEFMDKYLEVANSNTPLKIGLKTGQ
ncbi:hypothetical protein K8R33_03045 [archaeon]|nr:hypothetical protein [archaeon]